MSGESKFLSLGKLEKDSELHIDVEALHEFSSWHRHQMKASDYAGCFFCNQTFDPKDIKEWIDAEQTAMCPLCGIDSTLPGLVINLAFGGEGLAGQMAGELLKVMHNYWFKQTAETLLARNLVPQ